ncbi:hypothetical protein Hanom_Chr07g00659411 [Helianthus anomalus]
MVLMHGIKVTNSVGPDTDRRTNMYPILISRLLFCIILIGHECKKNNYIYLYIWLRRIMNSTSEL